MSPASAPVLHISNGMTEVSIYNARKVPKTCLFVCLSRSVRPVRPHHWFVRSSEKVVRPVRPQHVFVRLSRNIVRPVRPPHKSKTLIFN